MTVWVLSEERNAGARPVDGSADQWVLGVYAHERAALVGARVAETAALDDGQRVMTADGVLGLDVDAADPDDWTVCFHVQRFEVR